MSKEISERKEEIQYAVDLDYIYNFDFDGFYGDTQFRGIKGIYWTSTLYTGNPNKAWCLEFNFSDINVHYGDLSSNRFSGRCIRAVR